MKKLILSSLLLLTSMTSFGADQISVTINGQSYSCSGANNSFPATVVKTYCECSDSFGGTFSRIAVMSDGTTKRISSTSLTPHSGSYDPKEVMARCQEMLRQCR